MSQDVLGADPIRRPRPPGTRRRAAAALVVVALAGTGVYLAGRSNPAPRATAPPSVPASDSPDRPVVPAEQLTVVDLAVGTTSAYALVGRCLAGPASQCRQRLLVTTGDGTWTTAVAELPGPAGTGGGFSGRLLMNGDRPSLLEEDLGLVFPIEGGQYGRLPVVPGGTVPAVPAGATVEPADGRLSVLDPATGQRQRLAVAPPVGPVRTAAAYGSVVVAVGERGGSAVSTDRGAHWTAIRGPGPRPGAQVVQVHVGPGDVPYLLVGRETDPRIKNEFTELWRLSGGRWTNITPKVRPKSASSLVIPEGGLPLITEETGGVWTLLEDGTLMRMPDAFLQGLRVKPDYLVTGPTGQLLVSQGLDAFGRPALLSSIDGARTWDVYVPD